MIRKINCRNFKAFQTMDIELAPITLFLGPNNSGKSSILSGVKLLSQTLHSTDPSVSLLLKGINGDFGTYKDIVYGNSQNKHMEIGVTVSRERMHTEIEIAIKYKYRTKLQEIVAKEITMNHKGTSIKVSQTDDSEKFLIENIAGVVVPINIKSTISKQLRVDNYIPQYRRRFFSDETSMSQSEKFLEQISTKDSVNLNRGGFELRRILSNVEYVGAMRVPPQRTFMYSGEKRNSVGSNGEYSVSILAMDTLRRGKKSRGIKEKVEKWLNASGIASKLEINRISDRHFELKIMNKDTGEFENYADVGYGNSQILPVLIAGYNLDEDSVLIIEEPEIHLHPKAQFGIGDYLKDLFDQGVQSLVETHSEHLIMRIQQLVAKGELKPEDIAIYYLWSENSQKNYKRIEMDSQGQFLTEWPLGFFPERFEAAKELSIIRHGVL